MISAEQISFLTTGFAIILFVYRYFFSKKEPVTISAGNVIHVKVNADYSPSTIQVIKDKPVTLKILLTDPSDCLNQLVIPQLHVLRALPLNKEIDITFTPDEIGEFPFHCGMNMFHSRIIVRE